MWHERRSLALSRGATFLAMGLLAATLCLVPWLVGWLNDYSISAYEKYNVYFYITLYSGGLLAGVILWDLNGLLKNISRDKVFIPENVRYLRRISWGCVFGGIVCLVSAIYYLPWIFVGVAGEFIGLIVRVVKNVMADAVKIKRENDFTI